MGKAASLSWNGLVKDVVSKFTKIVTDSPTATVGLVLSTFLGYGISYAWFEYRKPKEDKLPLILHIVLGLGYAAVVFTAINFDLLKRSLNVDEISQRMPITLLVSFLVAFFLILSGIIYRQRS